MTYVRQVDPPLYVGSFHLMDEKRPARATGEMRWPLDGPGSRRNLIRCAAAILNEKYARSRQEWRRVTPLITKEAIAAHEQ